MKYIFNTVFFFGILAYIGAGTVPVWKCLKENKLKITLHCSEKDTIHSCCSMNSSPSMSKINDICCELIDQPWASTLKKAFDQSLNPEKNLNLAYQLFEPVLELNSVNNQFNYIKHTPTRGSPPIYKLNSTYIC